MKIVLASGSPRRKEILENMNLKFDIIKSEIEETTIENESPKDLVKRLSYEKAYDIASKNLDSIVIGADTVVVLDNVSKVKFKNLSDEEIYSYIKTGECMDKAGAYGIQGLGGLLVEYIKGDYFNIVGFPISSAAEILKNDFNIDIFKLNEGRFV